MGHDLVHLTGAFVNVASRVTILFFPKVLYGLNEDEFILNEQKQKSKSETSDQLDFAKGILIQNQLDQV